MKKEVEVEKEQCTYWWQGMNIWSLISETEVSILGPDKTPSRNLNIAHFLIGIGCWRNA